MHDAVEALPAAQERRLVHADRLGQVEVDVAVAEMAEGADAHARHRRSQAALAASMNSATRETGTATSCLIEPPSRPCTSDRLSRRRQSARFCASLARDRRVLDEAVLDRGAEHVAPAGSARSASACGEDSSTRA